jgi:LysM repeat protein
VAAAAAPVEQSAAPANVAERPVATASVAPVEQQPPAAPVSPISGNRIHRVRPGDNLTKVANLYNVSISDLEAVNGLKPGAILRPAQALNIPDGKAEPSKAAAVETRKTESAPVKKTETMAKAASPAKATASPKSSPKTYTVKKGENPVAIARQLGVSYSDLLKLNKISDPRKVQIGQVLKVPAKKRD